MMLDAIQRVRLERRIAAAILLAFLALFFVLQLLNGAPATTTAPESVAGWQKEMG